MKIYKLLSYFCEKKAIWRLRLQHTWYLYHCCPVQRTGFPCIPLYIHLYYDKILMICFQLIHHKDLSYTKNYLNMFWKKNKIIKNTSHIAFNGLHMKDDLFTEHIL